MSRYCDRGACAEPASWRVKRDRQSSGGITTDAYCDGCRDLLMADPEAPTPATRFEAIGPQVLNTDGPKKA